MLFEEDFLRVLEKIDLVVKKTLSTGFMGQHRSNELGGGLEFSDYRQYQLGDDYRYIDWNLYSRLGQLFLKQFTEEREISLHFLIDKSRSMEFGMPSKFDIAVKIAGALGYIGLTQLDKVGAAFFTDKIEDEVKSGKGKDWVNQYFQFLEKQETGGNTEINSALNEFSFNFKNPGLIIILSDFLDDKGYEKGLKKIREKDWPVLVIQTLARQELVPELEGEVRLVDMEKENIKEISVNSEIMEEYKNRINDFQFKIENFCKKYGIDFIQIQNKENIEKIIFNILKLNKNV